mgnify:CR=1 FL=1
MIKEYSVLMSVYYKDKPEYLKMAIESMLNQTIMPEQYIIVEDGWLPENLNKIINEYCNKYQKNVHGVDFFTIVKIQENKGLANALNEGLKVSRNELVARMDADDISLPQRCEKEMELFEKESQLEICGCNIAEFYGTPDNIKTYRIVPSEYDNIKKFMKRRTPFNHPTVMYKKSSVLKNGGYSVEIMRKQDYDLFSRMIVNGVYARNVNETLFLFRADENNYARRKSLINLKNAFKVYWRHYKRGGCSIMDFALMTSGEIIFFIAPIQIMKFLSDKYLRKVSDD